MYTSSRHDQVYTGQNLLPQDVFFHFDSSVRPHDDFNQYYIPKQRCNEDVIWSGAPLTDRISRDNTTMQYTITQENQSIFPFDQYSTSPIRFTPQKFLPSNAAQLQYPYLLQQPEKTTTRRVSPSVPSIPSHQRYSVTPAYRVFPEKSTATTNSITKAIFDDGTGSKDRLRFDWPSVCTQDRQALMGTTNCPRGKTPSKLRWGSDTAFASSHYMSSTCESSIDDAANTWMTLGENMVTFEHHLNDPHASGSDDLGSRNKRKFTKVDEKQLQNFRRRRRREIHKASEQKRRDELNKGYLDLCDIVPGLDMQRQTRKEILFRTIDWLQKCLLENENLKLQVHILVGGDTKYIDGSED
ncbi:hypothetical protein BGW36DRAFT_12414 [Talaromyces proteolyticus]|uniref:BHLH domain-containing protein n=1 Tax=Talaromyces proteolyticus TaxID=1131652 RepID=A0AAD4L3S1_9EURO|nr:uncharacterized protein BGW36DRAFT_12414 [Talaromyces proteolyticus]KAH8705368.1 hypothetical protein BGW36DRAFT_12414 [Talaromyces proteolyticus]